MDSLIDFLKNKLNESKRVNPAFSIRTFALRAGISAGAMSEILSGKRSISRKLAQKMATNLKLNPTERSQFLSGVSNSDSLGIKKVRFLNQAQFQYITDPAYFNFLALMDTDGFKNDPLWIGRKLNIPVEKVSLIIIRLKELSVLIEQNGELAKTKDTFSTSDDIKDDYVITSHRETLKSASRSLTVDPVALRDFTSFCFPADPNQLPVVKQKIRAFQDELAALMVGSKTTEVYKLAIQLYPQTQTLVEKDLCHVKKINNY